jgi:small subunit ribosomal protein S16
MAVRIRLTRTGRHKVPTYRVVVADSRSPRDGKFIDVLGRYDPRPEPSVVEIDNEKSVRWLMRGAQPSEAVRKLLEISGAIEQFERERASSATGSKKASDKSRSSAGGEAKKAAPKTKVKSADEKSSKTEEKTTAKTKAKSAATTRKKKQSANSDESAASEEAAADAEEK